MFAFKHARVLRGGVTASYLSFETASVWGTPEADGSASISTTIASKGGGDTFIRVNLTEEDVEQLMLELVRAGGLAGLSRLLRVAERGTEILRAEVGHQLHAIVASAETEVNKLQVHASKLMDRGPFGDGYKVLSGATELQAAAESTRRLGRGLGLVVEPRKKKPAKKKSS